MKRLTPGVAALALLCTAPPARADFILDPASTSTPPGVGFGHSRPHNVRNQSRLSAGYTSLLTDFDAYIAGNPTRDSTPTANDWVSGSGTTTGFFNFGLGGTFA